MSKMQREKGKRFEREVVAIFNAFGFHARRGAPMQAGHPDALPDVDVRGFRNPLPIGYLPVPKIKRGE